MVSLGLIDYAKALHETATQRWPLDGLVGVGDSLSLCELTARPTSPC